MRHSQIAVISAQAAFLAAGKSIPSDDDLEELEKLYAYARERKFPAAETLARKHGENLQSPFPYASLADAPSTTQHAFVVFRAVAEALEPFYEPDPDEPDEPLAAETKPRGGPVQPQPAPESDLTRLPTAQAGDGSEPEKPAEPTTESGQKAMDDAIAQSGGNFQDDTAQPQESGSRKKTK